MKLDTVGANKLKATLEKQESDLINQVNSLNLSKKDHNTAMHYVEKGKIMADNIYKDSAKLSYFIDSLNATNTTEDMIQVLARMFKNELIKNEGNKAKEQLNAFCKEFNSKRAQKKLKEYDTETRTHLLKMIEALSTKET